MISKCIQDHPLHQEKKKDDGGDGDGDGDGDGGDAGPVDTNKK